MKYFYDTEFLEDGSTIELISIGIIAEDGREYYAINSEITRGRWWISRFFGHDLNYRIRKNPWLMKNVIRSLPQPHGDRINHLPDSWLFDYHHKRVKNSAAIAQDVRDFLLAGDGKPELWAYYSAYDHVVLAQLFGPMIDLPEGIPMWTNDIMQLHQTTRGADDHLPEQTAGLHNALDDARHVQVMHNYIKDGYQ